MVGKKQIKGQVKVAANLTIHNVNDSSPGWRNSDEVKQRNLRSSKIIIIHQATSGRLERLKKKKS